jgi:hypothetical protein
MAPQTQDSRATARAENGSQFPPARNCGIAQWGSGFAEQSELLANTIARPETRDQDPDELICR